MAEPNDVIASIISSMAQGQAPPTLAPQAMAQQVGAAQSAPPPPDLNVPPAQAPMGPDAGLMPPPPQPAGQPVPDQDAMSRLMSMSGQASPLVMQPGQVPPRDPNAGPQVPSYKGRMPLAVRALKQFIHPASGTVAGERVPSRTNVMEGFLSELMGNFSAGLAAAGHGPGANLRGAAAAMQAPYQRDVQDYQMQQQEQSHQSQLAQQAAQTAQTQTATRGAEQQQEFIRQNMKAMGGSDADNVISNLGKLSSDEDALIQAGRLEGRIKHDASPLMAAVKQITQNRAVSGREGAGTVIENSNSPSGYSKVFYDKTGKNITRQEDNIPPPQGMIPKTTFSQRLEKDQDGNIVIVPTTTTTGPSAPVKKKGGGGGSGGRANLGPPVPGGGGQPRAIPVLAADGTPLHKPLSQAANTTVGQISAAMHLADRIQPDIESVVADMKRGGNLMDAAKVRSAWKQYQALGIAPANIDPNSIVAKLPNVDPRIARILPTIAMLQIVGAQPYLRNIRRFEFIKQVQQHLPDPEKDTPQLMMDKLQQLNRNLPLMLAATYKGEGVTPKLDELTRDRYMRNAGGDANKARLMARQDGWDISKPKK